MLIRVHGVGQRSKKTKPFVAIVISKKVGRNMSWEKRFKTSGSVKGHTSPSTTLHFWYFDLNISMQTVAKQ